jgi:hypothetical protein
MQKNWLIDRRTCLKGMGASLALPLLESMGWAEQPAGRKFKPPVRLGFMYMPHGVIMDAFWPKDPKSFLSAPPPALESLRPVLAQCLMMKGISGVPISPLNGAPHALELSTWLTASLPDARRRNVVNIAISADQIAANYVGALTELPSLELATMPQTHKENQEGLNEARSMLDLVLGGAKDLRRNLGAYDQRKLDEYLDSIRSVERRIAAVELRQKEAALEAAGVSVTKRNDSDSPPIQIEIPEGDKRSEYMKIMCDLTVLAFQTDTTRVSTYIGSTPNGVSYPELGFTDQHHSVTHHNNEAGKVEKVAKITEFNVAQFAYMIQRMQSLTEGEGTLLDNCIMMWGSGLEDGNKHSRENLPFIIAGRGGGSIQSGRFLTGVNGNQGDLLGTLLTCAGIPLDRQIGIGTKLISEISSA